MFFEKQGGCGSVGKKSEIEDRAKLTKENIVNTKDIKSVLIYAAIIATLAGMAVFAFVFASQAMAAGYLDNGLAYIDQQVGRVMLLTKPGESTEPLVVPQVSDQPNGSVVDLAPTSGDVFEINLDDDAQFCEAQCTWDIGVNDYTDGSTAQVGFAWGEKVIWEGNKAEAPYNLVILNLGFYEDLTIKNGGVFVYNVPAGFDEASLEKLTMELAANVYNGKPVTVPAFAELPKWDSTIASISNSAEGPEGVGEGLEFPQLDGWEFSCAPEASPCNVTASVSNNQIAIVFGVQIEYPAKNLAGPVGEEGHENDPVNRCDLVALDKGQYDLVLSDARIEIYNVPAADPIGWFENLVGERAEEQHGHYGCPKWDSVQIWSEQSGHVSDYVLTWVDNDATAVHP